MIDVLSIILFGYYNLKSNLNSKPLQLNENRVLYGQNEVDIIFSFEKGTVTNLYFW